MKVKKYLYLLLKLIVAGVALGLVISFFQYMAHLVIHNSGELIKNSSNIMFIIVLAISILYFIFLVGLNRKITGYTGSGIPQLEAYHDGWYTFNPLLMIVMIFVNSLSAFYGGFLLGGEGPSVSIGGALGVLINKIDKKDDKEIVAAMSSAGFGVALMAPVAGFFHLMEENKKILSFRLLFKGLVILVISYTISYFLYRHQIFNINIEGFMKPIYYLYIPLFIVLGIILGKLFKYILLLTKDIFAKYKWLDYATPLIAALFIVLRRYAPSFSASGAALVSEGLINLSLWVLLATSLWRMVAGGLSLASKVSGGLTLPTLAFGFLIGGLICKIISFIDPGIIEYAGIFMTLTMVIVFAAVCDTPLAGLFVGLSLGSLRALALPLTIGVAIYLIYMKLSSQKSIYKDLESRLPGYKEHHYGEI